MKLDDLLNSSAATITKAEAAEVLGIDPRTLGRGIEEGTIPSIKIGRRVVVPRVPFLRLLTGAETSAA